MRLTREQTKRIMECIAKEMGVELGDKILLKDGMAEVIVDSGGLINKEGRPMQTIMPLLRGAESFEKVPWEPKYGDRYYSPCPSVLSGVLDYVYTNRDADIARRKRVGVYRTEAEAVQKARELGWIE